MSLIIIEPANLLFYKGQTKLITVSLVTKMLPNSLLIKADAVSKKYESYFYPATFNNFAARMDGANDGVGNWNPVVLINKEKGPMLSLPLKAGHSLTIDAWASY